MVQFLPEAKDFGVSLTKYMKYKNVDIGDKPTKEQFKEYVSRMGYILDVEYWYNKYDARRWLTKKKTPIQSLETLINVINGIVIQRRKSNRDTNTGKKIKQTSVPKPTASTKKEKINASDVVKLSLDERKKLYEKIDSIPKKGRTKQQKLIRKKLRRSFTEQEIKDIERRKRKEYYNRLLEDKRWKEFRLKVLSERGNKCECCGGTDILQIHHTFYISGKMPWEYDIKDMRVLCKECHQRIHNIIQ